MITPSELDRAYMAGIIDGEGSITVTAGKWLAGRPVVSIETTDHELIDWVKERWGGYSLKKKRYVEHHQQTYTWRKTNRSAIVFLAELLPFLVIERKRERARMLVEEYESVTPRNGVYSEEMREAKRLFNQALLAIK